LSGIGVGTGVDAGGGGGVVGVCAKAIEAAQKISTAKEGKPLVRTRTSIPLKRFQLPV
jgi:hypothetical protein